MVCRVSEYTQVTFDIMMENSDIRYIDSIIVQMYMKQDYTENSDSFTYLPLTNFCTVSFRQRCLLKQDPISFVFSENKEYLKFKIEKGANRIPAQFDCQPPG